MTKDQRTSARAMLAAASPRPWLRSMERHIVEVGQLAGNGEVYSHYDIGVIDEPGEPGRSRADDSDVPEAWDATAKFIAGAPVPEPPRAEAAWIGQLREVLAENERLKAEVAGLKALLQEALGELRNHDRDSFGHPVSTVVELIADIKAAVSHG